MTATEVRLREAESAIRWAKVREKMVAPMIERAAKALELGA